MLPSVTRFRHVACDIGPGVLITGLIGGAGFAVHGLPGLGAVSPAIIAAITGLVLAHTLWVPQSAEAGIAFSSKTLLRIAVALLGLQVSLGQVLSLGGGGFLILSVGLVVSFFTIKAVGRALGVSPQLAELIAAGTSICGASAVAATNSVTEAPDEDVAYAVAMVTLFGTIAMAVYPLCDRFLHLDMRHYGLWAGASIHEVAQVAGATVQIGPEAEQSGAIAKLVRVLLLAPLVAMLKLARPRAKQDRSVGIPLFVLGFIVLVVWGSIMPVPKDVRSLAGAVSGFLLAAALGGMGLKTHIGALKAKG